MKRGPSSRFPFPLPRLGLLTFAAVLASAYIGVSPAYAGEALTPPLALVAWGGSLDSGDIRLSFSRPIKAGSLQPNLLLLSHNNAASAPLLAAHENVTLPCVSYPTADTDEVVFIVPQRELFALRARQFGAPAESGLTFALQSLPMAATGVRGETISPGAAALPATLEADSIAPEAVGFSVVVDTTRAGALALELDFNEPAAPWITQNTTDVAGLQLCVQMPAPSNPACVALQLPQAARAVATPGYAVDITGNLRLRLQTDLTDATAENLRTVFTTAGLFDAAAAEAGGGNGELALARAAAASLRIPGGLLSDTSGNVQRKPTVIPAARRISLRVPGPRLQRAVFDLQLAKLHLNFDMPIIPSSFVPDALLVQDERLPQSPLRLSSPDLVVASPAPSLDAADPSGRTLELSLSGKLRYLLAPVLSLQRVTGFTSTSMPPSTSTSSSSSTSSTAGLNSTDPTVTTTPTADTPSFTPAPSPSTDSELSAPKGFVLLFKAGGIFSSEGLGVTSQEDVVLTVTNTSAMADPPIVVVPDTTPPELVQANVDLDTGLLQLTLSEPVVAGRVRPQKLSVFLVAPGQIPEQLQLRTAGGVIPVPAGADGLSLALPLAQETLGALRRSMLDDSGALRQDSLPLQVDAHFIQDFEHNANVLAVVQLHLEAVSGILGPAITAARISRLGEEDNLDLTLTLSFSAPIEPASLRPEALRLRIARTGAALDSGIHVLDNVPVLQVDGRSAHLDVTGLSAIIYDAQASEAAGVVQSVLFQALPAGLGTNLSPAFLDKSGRGNVFSQTLLDMSDADLLPPTLASLELRLPSAIIDVHFSEPVLIHTWYGASLTLDWDNFGMNTSGADGLWTWQAKLVLNITSLGEDPNRPVTTASIRLGDNLVQQLADNYPLRARVSTEDSLLSDRSGNIMQRFSGRISIQAEPSELGLRLLRFDVVSAAELLLHFSAPVFASGLKADMLGLQSGRNSTRGSGNAHSGVVYVSMDGHVIGVEGVNAEVSGSSGSSYHERGQRYCYASPSRF
jgi:hypothetical protein